MSTITLPISILTVLLFISTPILAQNTHFGMKGTMNFSGVSGLEVGDDFSKSMRLSFGGGLFFNQKFSPKSSIQIEALYSTQGVEIESKTTVDELYRLDYLSVPIMYRYHFNERRAFSFQIGIQPSFALNNQVKIQGGEDEGVIDFDEYFEGTGVEVNDFDLGLTGGFGFGFGLFSTITLTYTYGLTDIFKGEESLEGAKHSFVQLGLCIPLNRSFYHDN